MPAITRPPDAQVSNPNNDSSKNLDFDLPALLTLQQQRSRGLRRFRKPFFKAFPLKSHSCTVFESPDRSGMAWQMLAWCKSPITPREGCDNGWGTEPLSLWGPEICFPVWPWWMGLVSGTRGRIKKSWSLWNERKKKKSFIFLQTGANLDQNNPSTSIRDQEVETWELPCCVALAEGWYFKIQSFSNESLRREWKERRIPAEPQSSAKLTTHSWSPQPRP